MSIERKPSKFVVKLLVTTIRTIIKHRSNIIIEKNDTIDLKPPYIILGNHVNNWDPLYINSYVKDPICFVAGETLFRNALLKRVLNYVGAIPKMKFKADASTIRSVLKAKKHKRVIGIFPEGNRNWDGTTEPLVYATAKLVKSLDIPVVVATIRGGHLTHPRWAAKPRKGTIAITLEKKWDKGDLKNDSTELVHKKLTEALHHNEMEWQLQHGYMYKGKRLANYLERLLFICPHCHTPGKMVSKNDLFICEQCKYTVRYTNTGMLEQVGEQYYFTTTRDWNLWQLKVLQEMCAKQTWQPSWKEAMEDQVKLYVGDKKYGWRYVDTGRLTMDKQTIHFSSDKSEHWKFSIGKLNAVNIHLHHKLDFYTGDQIYRIEFYRPQTSAYKWLKVIQTVKNNQKNLSGVVD